MADSVPTKQLTLRTNMRPTFTTAEFTGVFTIATLPLAHVVQMLLLTSTIITDNATSGLEATGAHNQRQKADLCVKGIFAQNECGSSA